MPSASPKNSSTDGTRGCSEASEAPPNCGTPKYQVTILESKHMAFGETKA